LCRENIHHTQENLPRIGRTPKLDSRDHRRLAREIVIHPGEPWDYVARQFNVSSEVIRKIAASMGYHKHIKCRKPWVSAVNIAKRCQWVVDNKDQDWRQVIFTNECSIELGEDITTRWTIRKKGEAYLPQHLQQTFRSSRKGLMVWGVIAYGKKFDLVQAATPIKGKKWGANSNMDSDI
jgi:hypothetical protein